jgi:hypothetical protein
MQSPLENQSMPPRKKRSARKWHPAIVYGAPLAILLLALYVAYTKINDPYRTLETFPVAAYYNNFNSLVGARFKAELAVEADLGYREGIGRLMVFRSQQDGRTMAVLLKSPDAEIFFSKGQIYLGEVQVGADGLILFSSLSKR